MKKYMMVLIVLFGIGYTQKIRTIYTNQTQPIDLVYNGENYLCFDEYNKQILEAQIRMFYGMYLPTSNCVYSNMVIEMKKLESYKKKDEFLNKIKTYGIVGFIVYSVITTVIIILK